MFIFLKQNYTLQKNACVLVIKVMYYATGQTSAKNAKTKQTFQKNCGRFSSMLRKNIPYNIAQNVLTQHFDILIQH